MIEARPVVGDHIFYNVATSTADERDVGTHVKRVIDNLLEHDPTQFAWLAPRLLRQSVSGKEERPVCTLKHQRSI